MIERDDPRLRLCVVTDDLRDGIDGLVSRMQAAERGGATMVLLRLKHADAHTLVEAGRALVQALSIPVLVRDRLDVAMVCGAAGVHLTADSMPVAAIRTQAPPGFLVAASVTKTEELPRVSNADFITAGPVTGRDSTGLGLDGFETVATTSVIPVLAVGGVTVADMPEVRRRGGAGVLLVALPQSGGDIASYVAAYAHGADGVTDARAAGDQHR